MTDPSNYSQFFGKLKAVCRNIEHGISQLQNDVETKKSSRSTGNAVMKLRNLKQEILNMKADGREKCQTLSEGGEKFNELVSCCHSLIDIQSHKLENIAIFMKQYGYKDYKPKEEKKDDDVEKEEEIERPDDMKENQPPVTSTPPQSDSKPRKVKTPKPEDFGFSSYTLRAMERGFHTLQEDFISRTASHSEAIPSVFNDESVRMTPSVFGRHVPFYTPGNNPDSTPAYHDIFTPVDKKSCTQAQKYGSDIPKLNLADGNTDSPQPPVFQTPSVKHLGKKEIFDKPGPVSSLNSVQKAPINSPKLPVFQSESMKKLMAKGDHSNNSVKTSKARLYDDLPETPEFGEKTSNVKLCDELPQTPELTVNIKKLREEYGLHKEPPCVPSELHNQSREPIPPSFQYKGSEVIDITMPKEFQPLADRLGHDITSNITPPMPEMLSDRHSKFSNTNGGQQQIRDLSKTPPTPKFLTKYANDLVHKK